jgi:antitoxin (DNA-binding transcriptional repressor) of toxin-antitoxin stability system
MLAGEAVTITRRGVPVARLEPAQEVEPTSGPMDMDWLKRVRIKSEAEMDSVTLLRRMRDEEI